MVKHLVHIRELLGTSENIGIGADFDGIDSPVPGLQDVSEYPNLFRKLYYGHGWTLGELAGLASENILRVIKANDDYAEMAVSLDLDDGIIDEWLETWIRNDEIDRVAQLQSEAALSCRSDYNLLPTIDDQNPIIWTNTKSQQSSLKAPEPSKTLLIDGHNDMAWQMRTGVRNSIKTVDLLTNIRDRSEMYWVPNHTDLERASIGELNAQFWSVYVSCSSNYKDSVRHTMEQIDVVHRMNEKYRDQMELVGTADEIEAAIAKGKFASLMGIEGGHQMDSSLGVLRLYYDLGVRYMTLTHNCNTPWSDNHNQEDRPDQNLLGGLSDWGIKVMKEMNRIGMMIDLAHVSADTMRAAISASSAPVIFSHSNARNVHGVSRNVPDDVMEKIKENDGIIMLNTYPGFTGEYNVVERDTPSGKITDLAIVDLAEHAYYIKEKIGAQFIGIGADLDGIETVLSDFQDVRSYPQFFSELAKRGFTDEEIEMVKGKNLLRVMRGVEAAKEALAGEKPEEQWLPKADLMKFEERYACRTDTQYHPGPDPETTTTTSTTTTSPTTTSTAEPTTSPTENPTTTPVVTEPFTESTSSTSLLVVSIFMLVLASCI